MAPINDTINVRNRKKFKRNENRIATKYIWARTCDYCRFALVLHDLNTQHYARKTCRRDRPYLLLMNI